MLGKRLRYLRERKKLSQLDLSKILNIPNQSISNYERGFRQPDYDILNKLADYFDVTVDYLLGRSNEEYKSQESTISKMQESSADYNLTMIRIPVLGHISAGRPILAYEHIDEYTSIPKLGNYNDDELFMLKVKGDSMVGSRIYEGDRVVVKMQPEVENGEIAVVNVNGDEATLKKVRKLDNGQTLLIPSNEKYEPILIDHENARIVGKVIQVIFEP